jgi:hypothetical protein
MTRTIPIHIEEHLNQGTFNQDHHLERTRVAPSGPADRGAGANAGPGISRSEKDKARHR